MILIGSMRVRNCKVIVWLLYGYCMVRAGNLWAISDMSYRHIIVGLAILCKDTTKFSNFQIFKAHFSKKSTHFLFFIIFLTIFEQEP